MAHLYFTQDSIDETTRRVELTGDEAHHAAQVARLREGESIEVSDGRGWRAAGIARSVAKSRVEVDIEPPRFEAERAVQFTLVQALAKGDRDEMAVQASTELGVSRVVPWQSERSVSRWDGDKRAKGVARWRAIAREAAKQSVRARIPDVADPVSTAGIVEATGEAHVLVLDPRSEMGIGEWVRENPGATVIAVVVGPEGGITEAEVQLLVSTGATAVRVGDDIMRTSTAGPAAIAALSALLGQW